VPSSPKAQPLEPEELRDFLERIGAWDTAAWLAHRERYLAAYGSFTFLPPECQNAVVLQANPGQAAGAGFGGSPVAKASARSPAAFEQHVHDVAALWGRRLLQSRIVFLAGSDVLHRPLEDVMAFLSSVGRTLPIEPKARGGTTVGADEEDKPRFDGVHAFLESFASPRPDRSGWRELAARGLVRISLGVESGDPRVRRIYSKSWDDDDVRAAVAEIKAADIGVSLLTLVGAGGVEFAERHVENTARLIESLELGAGDFVFLLDENEVRQDDGSPEGVARLQGPGWSEQEAKLKDALAQLRRRGVKVLPYTLGKQGA
jgi:hypothetical protein